MGQEFLQLGEYGVAGIMIAIVAVLGLTVRLLYKLATNHINHSNDIFIKNTEALTALKSSIDNNNSTLDNFKTAVNNLTNEFSRRK